MGRRKKVEPVRVPGARTRERPEETLYQRNVNIADNTRIHRVGSTYRLLPSTSAPTSSSHHSRRYKGELIETSEKGGSFGDQFLATMQRTVQQMCRDWIGTVMEFIIPILFIVLAIILWAAFGVENLPEKSLLDFNKLQLSVSPTFYNSVFCSDPKVGDIAGLSRCGDAPFEEYYCGGDDSQVPLKGLCTNVPLTSALSIFVNSLLGNAASVPRIDAILLYQWLSLKVKSTQPPTMSLSGSGVTPSTRYTALICSGKLYLAPRSKVPPKLLEYMYNQSLYFSYADGGIFDTIEDANAHVKSGKDRNWAVIEFVSWTKDDFDVKIHMNSTALPDLAEREDMRYAGGYHFDRGELYMASGFSTLQRTLYDFYFQDVWSVQNPSDVFRPFLAGMGSPKYKRKLLLQDASPLVAFILVLCFLYPVSQLTRKIVLDKELRIHEAVLIMGVSSAAMYLNWFVIYTLQYVLQCGIMTVMLKATLLDYSNPFIVYLAFLLFAWTTIPLSGIIAAFFSKARIAAMMAPLIFFVLSVPVFAFTRANGATIIGVSVLSPTAFASAVLNILTMESSVGFQPGDFSNPLLTPRPYILFMMLGIEVVVYYLVMLYLDAVLPKEWGTRKHPLFFIIDPIKYCCCCKPARDAEGSFTNVDGRAADGVFEDVDDADAAVSLWGLRKTFRRHWKKFVAVNNFYWTMKKDEISILLGHNGAGKSTTMNMMTGMIEPDEGDCYIYGHSVRHELTTVRQLIGFCPQHNILWPDLTCREHLEFFGKIKGLCGPKLENAVRAMLSEVDLMEKIEAPSRTLSGGQKRKLSIAIAFVGRSPLVFLDEPTAGMDVGARRHTWELLRRMALSRTILLTTHYMDEADILGQRIGILSKGRLQCSGSSMFLKSRLGVGYSMSVSLDVDADAEEVDRLVSSHVPSAEASNFDGVEIRYKLPMYDVERFPELLQGLEAEGEAAGVRGYSLTATTLEEVFLQIALDDMNRDTDSAEIDEEAQRAEEDAVWNCEIMGSSSARLWSQFSATMEKRFWNALRDRRMQCFQIVCPVVCILIGMLFTLVKYKPGQYLSLTSEMFGETVEVLVSNCQSYFGTITNPQQGAEVVDRGFKSAMDMSWYTIDTYSLHALPRYTAMFCKDKGMDQFDVPELRDASILFYNTSAYHSTGIVVAQFYSFLLQYLTRDSSRTLVTTTSPMPGNHDTGKVQGGVQTILIGAIVMIPFTFLPSNPVAWIVKERECRARHLQNVSGLNFYIYWIANFFFDSVAYIITEFLVIIIFLIFSRKEYVSSSSIGPTIVMFLVYGVCSTVGAYALSFVFKEHASAQTITMGVSFIAGFLFAMLVFILSLLDKTEDASKKLRWAFRLLPSYCVGESVINLAMSYQKSLLGTPGDPWDMDVVGWPCVYMAIEFPVFAFITLFIDHPRRRKWGQKLSYNRGGPVEAISDEDSDVEDEREAVYEQEEEGVNDDMVRVVDLRKVYSSGKVAVRNLSFSILPNEVFGFLGTNGAGKTTAISILCQEFNPTSGSAYICGYDVVDDSAEALQCIGYCPQFDATLDLLTVEQQLNLYAGIRAIDRDQRKTVVTALMRLCGITEYRKVLASHLSGGNRRKLSMAISLVGAPRVVFLDEPSAGMDPVARRGMWTTIQRVAQNCSVVLTTHHLEEVEALADTVAIMVDGALRCIGDKIHLKNKYGTGFEMSLRVRSKSMCDAVADFITDAFPDAVLNERAGQRFVYGLPQDTVLSDAFWTLQENKDLYGITDYSVSQTSIEQVFMRISEKQEALEAEGTSHPPKFVERRANVRSYGGNDAGVRDAPEKTSDTYEEDDDLASYSPFESPTGDRRFQSCLPPRVALSNNFMARNERDRDDGGELYQPHATTGYGAYDDVAQQDQDDYSGEEEENSDSGGSEGSLIGDNAFPPSTPSPEDGEDIQMYNYDGNSFISF